jgi:hypothetical protein
VLPLGYVLGLLFAALRRAQKDTSHPDPIHLTAHYLASLSDGEFKIKMKSIKNGRAYANVEAQLIQKVFGNHLRWGNTKNLPGETLCISSRHLRYSVAHPITVRAGFGFGV